MAIHSVLEGAKLEESGNSGHRLFSFKNLKRERSTGGGHKDGGAARGRAPWAVLEFYHDSHLRNLDRYFAPVWNRQVRNAVQIREGGFPERGGYWPGLASAACVRARANEGPDVAGHEELRSIHTGPCDWTDSGIPLFSQPTFFTTLARRFCCAGMLRSTCSPRPHPSPTRAANTNLRRKPSPV